MPITALYFRTRRPLDLGVTAGSTTINRRGHTLLRRALNAAMSALSVQGGDADYTVTYTATEPANAVGAITASSVATSFAATINGVSVSVTPSGGDTASCGLLAAAINASSNALVQGFVTASNLSTTLALTSVAAGSTVTICGRTFLAVSGTVPNTVSGASVATFDISGNDTADAAALAAAINSCPSTSRYVAAISTTSTVYLLARQFNFTSPSTFAWPSGPGVPPNTVISQASSIVAAGASMAASAVVGIVCAYPGIAGNSITLAASAGGGTAATVASASRLTLGTGLNVVGIVSNA